MEIGESLVYSWLKHVKKCSIVETNWKASELWDRKVFNEKRVLISEIKALLKSRKILIDVEALSEKNYKQTEVDVIGLNFDKGKVCYAFESAFHEKGLRYSKKDFKIVVIEKLLKASFVIIEYLGVSKAEIVFASPKLTSKNRENDLEELRDLIEHISEMFKKIGYDFNFDVYFDEDYKEMLILQLLAVVDKINNNTESFVRAVKLLKIFENVEKTLESNANMNAVENDSIGKYAKRSFIKILSNEPDKETDLIVSNLCDKEYSRITFGISYSVLVREVDLKNKRRYYSISVEYNEDKYFICSQWTNNHRERLVKWVEKIELNQG